MSDRLDDGDDIPGSPWLKPYMRVPGSRFVATDSFRLLDEAVREVSEEFGICVAYGDPGAGKTFALRVALARHCVVPVTWMEAEHRPTLLGLTKRLLERLGSDVPLGRTRDLIPPLQTLLEQPRLVVIDEAQRLTAECVDHLRYLHDQPSSNFGLALAGGVRCMEVLSQEPQLGRRASLRVEFTLLQPDEVCDYVRRFHPMYAGVADGLIGKADRLYAHGTPGLWTNLTKRFQRLLAGSEARVVNEELLEAALVRLDGVT